MAEQSDFTDFVQAACARLGVAEAPATGAGSATVPVGGVEVDIHTTGPDGGQILLYAEVGFIDEDPDQVREILRANHPEVSGTGIALALVPNTLKVSLSRVIAFDGPGDAGCLEAVAGFAEAATAWRDRLATKAPPAAEAPPEHWILG
jgi:hypothetical protein